GPINKLSRQIPFFKNDNIILSWGRGLIVDEKNKVIGKIKFHSLKQSILKGDSCDNNLNKLMRVNFIVPSSTVVIRKSSLLSIGGFKQPHYAPYADYPTYLELALKGKFFYIDDLLGYWRRHNLQVTSKLYADFVLARANLIEDFCKSLDDDFKKKINLNEKFMLAKSYWLKGRYYLIKDQSKKARREFLTSIIFGNFEIKIKSIFGIVFSFLKFIDLELFAKIFQRFKNLF
ncbi:unnamed protein product, partial [marine sediment metagenome]